MFICDSLESVELPCVITVIAEELFANCGKLESIRFDGSKDMWQLIEKKDNWNEGTSAYTVHCLDGNIIKAN